MSIHIANGFHMSNYAALAVLMQNPNFTVDWQNTSSNGTSFEDEDYYDQQIDIFSHFPGLKAIFYAIYISIFSIGICGNVLVYLLCTFAVPFTPLYMFMSEWVFGSILCHLVPYAQGVSVYISAFTLMSIAIDRFFVIIYPFKPRLQVTYCYLIIVAVWVLAGLLTLPYGIFMALVPTEKGLYCDEVWPHESSRRAFGFSTSILQFVVPFIIITFCYLKVCIKLKNRARSKPGAKSVKKEEQERERTRRTNRMLITMVVIFGASWLPINTYNLIIDFYIPAASWKFLNVIFFMSHAAAMSSTCYNPFLYAWLNENFRKEFMIVLPCFKSTVQANNPMSKRGVSGKADKSCNGHENVTLLPMKEMPNKDRKLQKDRVAATKNSTSVTETVRINVTNNDLDPM
ncbi:neuropeptide Y receptor type 6 [Trichonephila inaurata madagascariensis]|uniref:Neuropeptide Y receptor type 6 n=1 Tax=Trichonephila inaurata madagascariensis TaxID=2747483 RepID=A0A8X6XS57_9ARAC|nr:neuropeptide Y receptor type 6 [Trichonephila inaurata madagascariensis]